MKFLQFMIVSCPENILYLWEVLLFLMLSMLSNTLFKNGVACKRTYLNINSNTQMLQNVLNWNKASLFISFAQMYLTLCLAEGNH